MYHVQQKVVDSFAIGGVPQTRKRVYVVGWKRTCGESDAFEWPSVVPPRLLSDILAENNTKNVPWGCCGWCDKSAQNWTKESSKAAPPLSKEVPGGRSAPGLLLP